MGYDLPLYINILTFKHYLHSKFKTISSLSLQIFNFSLSKTVKDIYKTNGEYGSFDGSRTRSNNNN